MKIAISAESNNLNASVDPRFGRCNYFAIVDTENKQWEFIPNPGISSGGGAGIKAAQEVLNRGVKAVITGNVGPNAMSVLKSAGIEVLTHSGGTIQEAFNRYLQKQLTPLSSANAPSHFGLKQFGFKQ